MMDWLRRLLLPELEGQFRLQQEKIDRFKSEFRSIISAIREGLLVITEDGTIAMANLAAETIFSRPLENSSYARSLNNPEIIDLIRLTIETQTDGTREIQIADRSYIVKTTWLAGSIRAVPGSSRALVLTYDVTETRHLERVKKDFISNVSHELRTPLTAIKGFVETMREDNELNPHFLDVIHKHTERLINIVKDLLLLSKLEDVSFHLDRHDIDPVVLVKDVVAIFRNAAGQKGLALELDIAPNVPRVSIDPFKIEQVLVNLVDNALKYTEAGTITIGLKPGPDPVVPGTKSIILSISDTGIGIPREYHDRIFERFFVVDKSRSRTQGGTGLGLSIVKHIVQMHGGEIRIACNPQGTIFTISLPIG